MQPSQTWREVLGNIIKDPSERQRLASALRVNIVTLSRWASEGAKPRHHNLSELIKALPAHRERLIVLITQEYPDFVFLEQAESEVEREISSSFYVRVMRANANLPPSLHFWSMCDIILRQAVEQLDPNRVGVAVMVAQCMSSPSEQVIRSLRELVGRGTPPWNRELESKAIFLGVESLAGYAVTTGRPFHEQDLSSTQSIYPFRKTQWERSAAACPIMHKGRVAGSLIVSSTQIDYFLPFRLKLIQDYADLLVLTFEPEKFYDMERIKLGVMPTEDVQRSHLVHFQQRVAEMMTQAARQQRPISSVEAERLAWQQLEEELLQLSSRPSLL